MSVPAPPAPPAPPATAPTALVTGASRGIGRAVALALAGAGYDVAITARTVEEGTGPGGLPGSLARTAAEIAALGRRALPIRLDLLDREALGPAVEGAVAGLGHLDVLVNNAIYVSPFPDTRFLDTDPVELERRIFGDLTAQLLVTRHALRSMVPRRRGTVVTVTSGVATTNPTAAVGEGGWALAYACAKGGLHRAAGVLAAELGEGGIRCYNVEPGRVATERVVATPSLAHVAAAGKPPSVVGAAVAWLLAQPDGTVPNGRTLSVDELAGRLRWSAGSRPAGPQ